MHHGLRPAIATIAFVAGVTLAAAQSATSPSPSPSSAAAGTGGSKADQLKLSSEQKRQVVQGLAAERNQLTPPGFKVAVGATVPASVSLVPVPLAISNDVPTTKNYSFVKLENKDILLVDPKDRMIAEVINAPAATTGSGSR
jgi:hypothetical protein